MALFPFAQFSQLVVQLAHDQFELVVAARRVAQVILGLEPGEIGLLQLASLVLPGNRIRMSGVARQVQLVGSFVALASGTDDHHPSALAPLMRKAKLELCVGNPSEFRIRHRWLCAVALPDQLEQPIAGKNLLTQPVQKFTVTGREIILSHRIKAQRAYHNCNLEAGRAQLFAAG